MSRIPKVCAAAFLMLSASLFANAAIAHGYSQGGVTVGHPWSRPTPPGTPTGVGYLVITNNRAEDITLMSGSTPAAAEVTIHQSRMQDGLMSMEPVTEGLVIPAGETVELKPHSYHLMLEQLDAPLVAGQRIPLTLTFDSLGDIEVELMVNPLDDADGMDQPAHQHGH